MQKYDVTLTLSKKHIPIYADSYEKAMAQIGDMVAGLVLMDFKEEEIERITVNAARSPTESGSVQKPDIMSVTTTLGMRPQLVQVALSPVPMPRTASVPKAGSSLPPTTLTPAPSKP